MYALQECVRQMRGSAPAQIPAAKVSVCHGVGGMFAASNPSGAGRCASLSVGDSTETNTPPSAMELPPFEDVRRLAEIMGWVEAWA